MCIINFNESVHGIHIKFNKPKLKVIDKHLKDLFSGVLNGGYTLKIV